MQAKAEADAYLLQSKAKAASIQEEGNAEAIATSAMGLARAQAIEAEGMAEAKVVREKAMAEAEAKEKLAEAYQKYGEAAMTEMVISVLPEITKYMSEAVSSSMSKIGSITVIDSGDGHGKSSASKVSSYATDLLTQLPEVVKATTGIDMIGMLKTFSDKVTDNNISIKNNDDNK